MHIKIALAQINVTVGDISGNAEKIRRSVQKARNAGADVVVFPELSISGYPPQELLLEDEFVDAGEKALEETAKDVRGIIALAGYVRRVGKHRYNAVAVLGDGRVLGHADKTNIPAYDVFDELRYFSPNPAPRPVTVDIKGQPCKLGIQICEDLWDDNYDVKVSRELARQGADIILNASASPYHTGKLRERLARVREKVRELKLPFVYVNLVGGQDELIFDGGSFAVDAQGRLAACLPASREALDYAEFVDGQAKRSVREPEMQEMEELRSALVLGVRDYFYKSGFRDAVIGLSGGIDSALVAALAAEALGAEHVRSYAMPSRFSSGHSLEDAAELAENLGIRHGVIDIGALYDTFLKALESPFAGTSFGIAEENLQARIRGSILMSIANKKNALVLTTGNKTEIAIGYCTLYGDMCGALGPIADLNKLEVYRLAEHINSARGKHIIPERSLRKRPSAELAENQYDPFDYGIVSPLVDELLYRRKSIGRLIREYGDAGLVKKINNLIHRNEYKRWQAAPALRVTPKAFGRGRKMPMVNHFTYQ